MASSRVLLLATLVVVLGAVMVAEGLRMASGPKMCCFKFQTVPVPEKRVLSYIRTSRLCSNPAVIFQTAKREVCVQPTKAWVLKIISSLDSKTPGQQIPL